LISVNETQTSRSCSQTKWMQEEAVTRSPLLPAEEIVLAVYQGHQ
jgi:hypothetical protein